MDNDKRKPRAEDEALRISLINSIEMELIDRCFVADNDKYTSFGVSGVIVDKIIKGLEQIGWHRHGDIDCTECEQRDAKLLDYENKVTILEGELKERCKELELLANKCEYYSKNRKGDYFEGFDEGLKAGKKSTECKHEFMDYPMHPGKYCRKCGVNQL